LWSDTGSKSEPHFLKQEDLNNTVCDLNLSEKQAEILGSRLKGCNLCNRQRRQRLRIKVCQTDFKSKKENKCVINVTTVFPTKSKISHNLLHQDTKVHFLCNHQNEFKEFFSLEDNLVFCNDVSSVTEALGHQHNPTERRLFTDS
jgi:hypothetical protein